MGFHRCFKLWPAKGRGTPAVAACAPHPHPWRHLMKLKPLVVGAAGAVLLTAAGAVATATASASTTTSLAADASTAVADLGWATQSGGTTGGSKAAAAQIYTVSTKAQLIKALAGTDPATGKTNKTAPKIIKWVGTIDMTEGKPFTDHSDQATRAEVKLQD